MSPRTPLIRPDRYFATHEAAVFRVLIILGVLTVAGPATVYGVGWILVDHIDGTVVIDNPYRPPAVLCDGAIDSAGFDKADCDRPREIERNVDRLLWSAIDELLLPALVAFPIAWVLIGLFLHVGSVLATGEGGILPSFAVAAWGMLPTLVSLVVMLPVLALWLGSYTVLTNQAPEVALAPVRAQIEEIRGNHAGGDHRDDRVERDHLAIRPRPLPEARPIPCSAGRRCDRPGGRRSRIGSVTAGAVMRRCPGLR